MAKLANVLAKLAACGDNGPPDVPNVLPDEAFSSARASSVVSPEGFLAMIEMMREHERYGFADQTLTSIYDTVKAKGFVTEGQLGAVRNIRHAVKNWEDAEVEDV